MRIVKSLVMAGALVSVVPSLAHAQWYVTGEAGVSLAEKSKVTAGGTDYTSTYTPGPAGVAAVGRNYGAVKGELELGYRSNDISRIAGTNAGGNMGAFSTMANGLYDFNADGVWHPMLGAGIGVAHLNASNVHEGASPEYSFNQWRFAYQGVAALAYDLTSNWQAKVDYRYFATLDPTGSFNGNSLKGEYHDHTVLVGLTYKFNPPPAPVPVMAPVVVAPPPPAPPAAVAPAPLKNYIVFFDFDQASITAQAQAILEQAAATAKKGHVVHIQLTGHTDLTGSGEYNQKLSVRRAEAVKAALVKLGLDASEINVQGKGKSDPLVPTKDGVRQPQNRRVEILLQ